MVESKVFSYNSEIIFVERDAVRVALCKHDNWVFIIDLSKKIDGEYLISLASECMRKSEATIMWKSTLTHILIGELDIFNEDSEQFKYGNVRTLPAEKHEHVKYLAYNVLLDIAHEYISGYCAESVEFAGALFTLREDGLYECRTRDALNLEALPKDTPYVLLTRLGKDANQSLWLLCLEEDYVPAMLEIQKDTKTPIFRSGL